MLSTIILGESTGLGFGRDQCVLATEAKRGEQGATGYTKCFQRHQQVGNSHHTSTHNFKNPSVLSCLLCSHRLQDDKVIFDLNLEIQFLLKQGQVEVEMNDFIPDFSDSVLVHRSRIEDLNNQIKVSHAVEQPNQRLEPLSTENVLNMEAPVSKKRAKK